MHKFMCGGIAWSRVFKAQCHWAKDIEHFGIGKLRVVEIEQKRIVYI